jgi:hypothetical protein
VLWNNKNLTKTPDKTRCSGTVRISPKHYCSGVPVFFWYFNEILTVPEYLVLSVVLVRFLLFQNISLKHQIKSGTLEQ